MPVIWYFFRLISTMKLLHVKNAQMHAMKFFNFWMCEITRQHVTKFLTFHLSHCCWLLRRVRDKTWWEEKPAVKKPLKRLHCLTFAAFKYFPSTSFLLDFVHLWGFGTLFCRSHLTTSWGPNLLTIPSCNSSCKSHTTLHRPFIYCLFRNWIFLLVFLLHVIALHSVLALTYIGWPFTRCEQSWLQD